VNAEHRLATLRMRLADEGVPAMIVSEPLNVAYLTGFEGVFDQEPATVLVVGEEMSLLYTDSRYLEAARVASVGTPWEVRTPEPNPYETVCDMLLAAGVSEVALEDSVPYGRFRFISEKLGGNVVASKQWVEDIRQFKDADEIERIAAAATLTDAAFDHILGLLAPSATERDIALEIEIYLRRNGSDGVAFEPIVASGPNSALPHARPTDRAIGSGDFLTLDFGARVGGYCADMTRTLVVGTASERHREVYDAVLAANQAGIDSVTPGRAGRDVDTAARTIIDAAGFGELFGHGLGHGVGMAVHEMPTVGPRGRAPLAPGHVVTIEPGVYVPGFGGVRIEDLVVVTNGGCRVLSASPKDLLEV